MAGSGRRVQQRAGEAGKALSQVANEPITVLCGPHRRRCSRHRQVVHFETPPQRKDAAWTLGVNANLPGDIAVRWVKHVPAIFTPGSAPRRAAIVTSSIIIACVRRC
jgi:tRNA U38,U39,U40 pseudouridine synthase TruA